MTRTTLAAEDAEDLGIISAQLQDAVAQVKDFVWLPKSRRFAAVVNRFKWEAALKRRSDNLRVRSRLVFDSVSSVKSFRIKHDPDAVADLLAIRFTGRGDEDPSGIVELVFAGGGAIRLEVECIDASLTDVSSEWAALGRPDHETEGR
jgi:hypothetical protein